MIFITARFQVLPEFANEWPAIVDDFTCSTRAEEGCMWFEWARNVRVPTEYFVVEAFRDEEAGAEHVQSAHFKKAMETFPAYLSETPGVVNFKVDSDNWPELGEMTVPDRS